MPYLRNEKKRRVNKTTNTDLKFFQKKVLNGAKMEHKWSELRKQKYQKICLEQQKSRVEGLNQILLSLSHIINFKYEWKYMKHKYF
jgi:hypothetical protein